MRIVSLFSGAGGLDLGLTKAGHEIVWANDFDHDSCETYRKNISTDIVEEDIYKIKVDIIPDADVIVGGFPCQGFSLANLNRSMDDDRNTLYKQFVKVVKKKQPAYFLAENVKGLLSMDGGNVIKCIVKDFEHAGYRVKYKLFNAADYGVPEIRQRVIIAGTRKDLPMDADFEFPEQTHAKPEKAKDTNLKPWVNVGQALSAIGEPRGDKRDPPNHVYSQYKLVVRNFTGHRETDPKKPSPTILARGNGKGGVCAIPHPKNHRRMSVRESALVQTFPSDFVFVGSLGSCYRQVGNAVPVLFAQKLGEQLRKVELVVICE